MIAVLSAERLRGGTRLEFVCGGRALRSFRTLSRSGRRLYPARLGGARRVARRDRAPSGRKQGSAQGDQRFAERLAGFEAAALAAAADEVNGVRQVIQALEGRDQHELKAMAQAICSARGFRAALFSTTPPYVAVVARSEDGRGDCAAVIKSLMAAFGGRGGGRPEMAQCGGLTGDLSEILGGGPGRVRAAVSDRNESCDLAIAHRCDGTEFEVRPEPCGVRRAA